MILLKSCPGNQRTLRLVGSLLCAVKVLCAAGTESEPVAEQEAASEPEPVNLFLEPENQMAGYQVALDIARQQRLSNALDLAEKGLIQLLEGRAPEEVKRPALLELAFVKQEQKEWQKAQRLYAEFVRRYSKDPSVPEVLFRQASIYRELGLANLARTKLYAVISTCLNLQLDELEYYQKLVLRAQSEIAETHYLQGEMEEAADFFSRLLKLDSPELKRDAILYKLARCQAGFDAHQELVATCQIYLEKYPGSPDAPEMRFLLADGLKKLGRNKEALQEILVLLQSQEGEAGENPQLWRYWQKKAGNDIANQLYREGDYLSALQIYQTLAGLSEAAEWQLPVWYQIGLVYEHLKQNPKATEMYDKIAARTAEGDEQTPAMQAIVEMAAWRKQTLIWEKKARAANQQFQAELDPFRY